MDIIMMGNSLKFSEITSRLEEPPILNALGTLASCQTQIMDVKEKTVFKTFSLITFMPPPESRGL